MTIYIGYHIEDKYEHFHGIDFFTSKNVEIGSECFVVSGSKSGSNSTTRYRLQGKYKILEVNENRTANFLKKAWHLQLKELIKPSFSILLDGLPNFDRDFFHDNFSSGGGFRSISEKTKIFGALFDSLLGNNAEQQSLFLLNDLDEIDARSEEVYGLTERLDNRLSRIGQGKFRRNTIETWGGDEKCAVTGIYLPALLTASHIVPWREDEAQRIHGCNGVLLSAHLDRLFDRYLIGFKVGSNPDLFTLVVAPSLLGQFDKLAKIGVTTRSVLDVSNVKFADRSRLEINLRAHLGHVLTNK